MRCTLADNSRYYFVAALAPVAIFEERGTWSRCVRALVDDGVRRVLDPCAAFSGVGAVLCGALIRSPCVIRQRVVFISFTADLATLSAWLLMSCACTCTLFSLLAPTSLLVGHEYVPVLLQ